jgi:hypothetical protein
MIILCGHFQTGLAKFDPKSRQHEQLNGSAEISRRSPAGNASGLSDPSGFRSVSGRGDNQGDLEDNLLQHHGRDRAPGVNLTKLFSLSLAFLINKPNASFPGKPFSLVSHL